VTPFLLVLSAPSGGGKTSIARMLLERRTDLGYSVSVTTRPKRNGEHHGIDYYFLSPLEFEDRRKSGQLLEWAEYSGQYYGTLKSEIDRIFAAGRNAVLDVEIEGARQIRKSFRDSVHVFVLPPSAEVLVERLTGRKTEDPELLRARLIRAAEELQAVSEYDYAIVNKDLPDAVAEVSAILDQKGDSRRVSSQSDLPRRVEKLRRDVMKVAEKISLRSG
jgi:guanylate kinase